MYMSLLFIKSWTKEMNLLCLVSERNMTLNIKLYTTLIEPCTRGFNYIAIIIANGITNKIFIDILVILLVFIILRLFVRRRNNGI